MYPTVTSWSNCSPVRPSRSVILPDSGRPARTSSASIVSSDAPSKPGVATFRPSACAVRYAQRGIAHLARLLTEDGTQQALLGRELRLALGRDLAHQDVTRVDLRADVDDAALVEVLQRLIADIGDIARDLLRAQLGVAGFDLVLLDVDRGVLVLAHDGLRDQDRVFVVVSLPGHEGHQDVAAKRQLPFGGGRAVRERRASGYMLPGLDDDPL